MENELNKKLLEEGYTPKNPPPYAKWNSGWGWFEYTLEAVCQMVWETPCGLLRKGCLQDGCGWGSHDGVIYMPENNNLRIGCPYFDEVDCIHRDVKALAGWNCVTHRTDRPYYYEQSVEKIMDQWEEVKHAAWLKVSEGYGYCACMEWDRPKRRFMPRYHVMTCINIGCKNEVCAVTKRPRNLAKVNIYYDLLRERHYKKGLFEFTDRTIEKGIKQFETAVALTDAEIWLKRYGGEKFKPRLTRDDRRDLHFSKYHGKEGYDDYDWCEYKVTPQDIRIEKRESRDLLQDLRDAAEGIEVVHASDLKKEVAQAKRDRKAKRQEAKQRKIEKRLIVGWKKVLLEGVDSDGEPGSDVMKNWARKQLAKRGISVDAEVEVQEQASLF